MRGGRGRGRESPCEEVNSMGLSFAVDEDEQRKMTEDMTRNTTKEMKMMTREMTRRGER